MVKMGVTTGASNDIQRASQIARNMVTKWGLSDKLGPLMYDEEEGEVFLGKSYGSSKMNVSGETAKRIDEEVRSIIDECYQTAEKLLHDNRGKLDIMAKALIQYETIDSFQIDDIMNDLPPRPPKQHEGDDDRNGDKTDPVTAKGNKGDDNKNGDDRVIVGPLGKMD